MALPEEQKKKIILEILSVIETTYREAWIKGSNKPQRRCSEEEMEADLKEFVGIEFRSLISERDRND